MNRITTAILVLPILLVAILASTHTRGPDQIIKCSGCGQLVIYETSSSGNTIGIRAWTDKYYYAPMDYYTPLIVKCPSCNTILWIVESDTVGTCEFWETEVQFPEAITPEEPTENDLLKVADKGNLSRDKEMYARISSLWRANHAFRYGEVDTFRLSEQQIENIHKLMALLDEQDETLRLVKAEMARELGDFDESLRLLSPEVSDEFATYRSFIERLARAGIREVREILKESETDTNAE